MSKIKIKALIAAFALWSFMVTVSAAGAIVLGGNYASAFKVDDTRLDKIFIPNSSLENVINNIDFSKQNYNTYQNANIVKSNVYVTKTVLPTELYIPKLDRRLNVQNPQTRNIDILNLKLKEAVLRYDGTGTLAENSRNMLIFGHSSYLPYVKNKMYKAFNKVETLLPGDLIIVTGNDGKKYTYSVKKVRNVKAGNFNVQINTARKTLTLVTCNVLGAKEDRWIIEAVAN